MTAVENLTLADIDAQIAQLREQRRMLKKTGKVAERKITTLTRRRERLLEHVREIDAQIELLRVDISLDVPPQQRRRGRRPKNAQSITE